MLCHAMQLACLLSVAFVGFTCLFISLSSSFYLRRWCKSGDHIIGVHGLAEGVTGNTNLLKVLKVD